MSGNRQRLYVRQDRERFYFHLHNGETHQLISPVKIVSDYDADALRRARAWFKRQAKRNGYLISWEPI